MQGLSSRAHAFSVEALVGKKPCKMRKVSGGHDAGLAAEARVDTGTFTGKSQLDPHSTKLAKKKEPVRLLYFVNIKTVYRYLSSLPKRKKT